MAREDPCYYKNPLTQKDNTPTFRSFNPHQPVRVYRRNLPYWRQDGVTYFVTFRLADSIPEGVLLNWREQDIIWLAARGIKGSLSDPGPRAAYDALSEKDRMAFERRAARRLHTELDNCHGSCLLRRREIRDSVAGALHHFHGMRWWVGDFVIMPNHVHGLFKPLEGYTLETILGSVKGYTSTRLTVSGSKRGRLWQQENYDRIVRDCDELGSWRKYIFMNPEKAHLGDGEFTYHQANWLDDVGPHGPEGRATIR